MTNRQNHMGSRQAIALAAVLMSSATGLFGAEAAEAATSATAAPVVAPPKKWETSAAAGLTLTSGNSDTFLFTLAFDTKRKWEKDEVGLGISGGYGENTVNGVTTKNTEFVQGYGQYNRLFSDKFYGAARLDGQYDGIAGIEYRFKISPMAGYYFIKNSKMMLAGEGGPSLIMEHLSGEPAHAYWAARLAERFEYKITANTRVWESVEYLPKVDQWAENYLVNFEAGIETAITKQWSLRVVLQDQYASEPAPGRKSNDVRLLAGTAYKF